MTFHYYFTGFFAFEMENHNSKKKQWDTSSAPNGSPFRNTEYFPPPVPHPPLRWAPDQVKSMLNIPEIKIPLNQWFQSTATMSLIATISWSLETVQRKF